MDGDFHDRLYHSELGSCTCAKVRRISRKLSSFYDDILAPANLTITQYSLLATIGRIEPLTHSVLARKIGMDRTTLTRNLQPMIRSKWVITSSGQDRRQHLLKLTERGKQKLHQSLILWEKAQKQLTAQLGPQLIKELHSVLTLTESAITNSTK
jgi:DNA-binding MarR family transcriptional regulator